MKSKTEKSIERKEPSSALEKSTTKEVPTENKTKKRILKGKGRKKNLLKIRPGVKWNPK